MKIERYETTTTINKVKWICSCGMQYENSPDEDDKLQCDECFKTFQLGLETKTLMSVKEVDKEYDLFSINKI